MSRLALLKDPRGAVAAVLIASVLWGSAFPAIKRGYLLLELDPRGGVATALVFAGLRFLLAGALLLVGAAVFRLGLRVRPRQLAALALLGLIQTTLQYTTFYSGMIYTSAVKASIIVASGSFFLAALSPLVYRDDRLSPWRLLGLLVGFAGVVLANLSRASAADADLTLLGDGLILATGLCSATASLLSKRLVRDIHPVVVNGYQVTIGAIVLLLVATPLAETPPGTVGLEVVGLTFYLSVVTAVAFSLYYLVVKFHDLSRVAAYRFLIPVSGITLSSALVPGETLGPVLLVAGALVAFGIWSVNRPTAAPMQRP